MNMVASLPSIVIWTLIRLPRIYVEHFNVHVQIRYVTRLKYVADDQGISDEQETLKMHCTSVPSHALRSREAQDVLLNA